MCYVYHPKPPGQESPDHDGGSDVTALTLFIYLEKESLSERENNSRTLTELEISLCWWYRPPRHDTADVFQRTVRWCWCVFRLVSVLSEYRRFNYYEFIFLVRNLFGHQKHAPPKATTSGTSTSFFFPTRTKNVNHCVNRQFICFTT